ncbi:MAG: alpha/beta fold hydrolase [Oscillospiraceae bacterium]|nr:alpha/beta fold hydrolase [Oscillospiraceae bacterium]
MTVIYEEYRRLSLNGEGELFSRSWKCESPRAVIQIAHGMCEHSGRYERLGRLLAEAGFAVYMNDHCGHGQSQMGHPGTFSMKPHGFDFVLGDMKSLFDLAEAEFPGKGRILMGHSMGSILSGIYADHWGRTLSGLCLLSPPAPNRYVGLATLLGRIISRSRGYDHFSPLLHHVTSSSTGGTGSPIIRKQWLSHNMENIVDYMDDPLAGFEFSASATVELCAGLDEFGSKRWGRNVPKGLRVLILAGGEDGCGGYGAAASHYFGQLKKYGVRDSEMHVLPHARHEIFNELDTREAEAHLLGWLSAF